VSTHVQQIEEWFSIGTTLGGRKGTTLAYIRKGVLIIAIITKCPTLALKEM
jgi:hypothetical protein